MTVNVPVWIGLLYSVLLLGGGIGLGIANFRAGAQNTAAEVAKTQSAAIGALQAELSVIKDQNHRFEVQVASLTGERDQLLLRVNGLEQQVLGVPDWAILHKAMTVLEKNSELLTKVATYYTSPEFERQQKQHLEATSTILKQLRRPGRQRTEHRA